jgi:hypothetical protein
MSWALDWYQDTGHSNWVWLYRQKVTINSSSIDAGAATYTDFPVLVSITSSANTLFSKAKSNGDDIVFTSADGETNLTYEVDYINTATSTFAAWVRIPSLPSASNTTLYMYYGCTDATTQQAAAGVWNSAAASYEGVWHISQGGKTAQRLDSSPNGAHSRPFHLRTAGYTNSGGVNGLIGLGDNMISAETAYLSVEVKNNMFTWLTGQSMTISCWFKTGGFFTAWQTLVCKGDSSWRLHRNNNTSQVSFGDGTSNDLSSVRTVTDNKWHYFVGTYNAGTSTKEVYLDGSLEARTSLTSPNYNETYAVGLGYNFQQANRQFAGVMDEVRYSKIYRNKSWIKTEYNNQSSPSTFCTLAAEERRPSLMIVEKPERRRGRDDFL